VIGEVLDTLDGLFKVTRRTPTLDGSVPLRVARACVPLLEGNAYGLQLTLTRALRVRGRLGRWRAEWAPGGDDAERRHAGAWPRLPEEGYLTRDSGWVDALRGPLVKPIAGGLRVFTGLLVRPEPSIWLRVTATANRRNTLFEVGEQVIADDGAWVPIVLELKIRRGAPASFSLEGEMACLGALCPGARFESVPLAQAPELARAHAAFYDRAYFEDKREEVTGKYRRLVAGENGDGGPTPTCRVAAIGPSRHAVEPLDRFTTAAGPSAVRRPREPRLDAVVFRNEIAFAGLYDGHTLALEYDHKRLRERTRPVEAAWRGVLADGVALEHPGSELYLTRYFTPHPPGEPHFFVKPWALTATPRGWSSLLEGTHGDGYDVLRGVVSTDVFHATPAVFRVHREGARFEVADDVPLLRVIPVPRAILGHEFRLRRLA
jgi:hypothetical protein